MTRPRRGREQVVLFYDAHPQIEQQRESGKPAGESEGDRVEATQRVTQEMVVTLVLTFSRWSDGQTLRIARSSHV